MSSITKIMILSLVCSTSAAAYDSGFNSIKNKTPHNVFDAAKFYEIADVEMTIFYSELIKNMSEKAEFDVQKAYYAELKNRMILAQLAWIKYRSTSCELAAMHEGDTQAILFYEIKCMFSLTAKRVAELHRFNDLIGNANRLP